MTITMRGGRTAFPFLYYATTCHHLRSSFAFVVRPLPLAVSDRVGRPAFELTDGGARFRSSFMRRRDSDDGEDDSFLRKLAKKVLPKSLVPKSESEKRAERERDDLRRSINAGVSDLLRDAPFPVRALGGLVAPLFSSLAAQVSEQNRSTREVLEDARSLLRNSARARDLLGGDVECDPPYSQSSSSSSVNGRTSSVVRASFRVYSSSMGGTATVVARDGVVERLRVDAGGRSIDVDATGDEENTTTRGSGGGGGGTSRIRRDFNKDDVIDAEFVEKN